MKNSLTDFVAILCLILVILLDWTGYFICQDPQSDADKFWLWITCSVLTVTVAMIVFTYFASNSENKNIKS